MCLGQLPHLIELKPNATPGAGNRAARLASLLMKVGLYTRWFHRFALIIRWAVAMAYGTVEAYRTSGGGQARFGADAADRVGRELDLWVISGR